MRTMNLRLLLGSLLAPALFAGAGLAHGAASGFAAGNFDRLSVESGKTLTLAATFRTASGGPAANENVRFRTDCGSFTNPIAQPFNPGMNNETVSRTDSTGLAQATFTAVTTNDYVGCSVVATAGEATVTFGVVVFNLTSVTLTIGTIPALPGPGEPFFVVATARAGPLPLRRQTVRLAINPSSTATGTITSASTLITEGSGSASFSVAPHTAGRFDFEATMGNAQAHASITPGSEAIDQTGLWWAGAAENGWGMSVERRGNRFFNVIYAYDNTGRATWYVMPGGTWDEVNQRMTGALYAPRSAPYFNYSAASLSVGAPAGMATITFGSNDVGVLEYTIAGISDVKRVERQRFANPDASVAYPFMNGMWWGGTPQNGWGIAMMQQYSALFIVWFTYDEAGRPTWFVMPSGGTAAPLSTGRIFRTSGPSWLGTSYNASLLRVADVGSFTLRIPNLSPQTPPTLQYTVDGRSGTMQLFRHPY